MYKNKNNFEEQFIQPSIQETEKEYDPLLEDDGPGRPIQLIKIKSSGRIQIDQDALQIISRYSLPIGFCCIAGKYRTGKSFLLNKLLKLEGSGFRVDPSTHACTQGIWMWTKPLLNQAEQNYIFFIDTQGTASLNRDTNNDAKIFTMANLLSSYLIYNSVGSIDEKSISELNLVTQLSKNIIIEQQQDLKSNQDVLHRYMPKFLWLLRDFTLQPTDKNGRRLTPSQYLEDSLTQQNLSVKFDENSKKIRRSLLKYYINRDCFTLVRPANQQRDLQNLNQIPDHNLRRDFIQGVNTLRQKILKNCGPKVYNDKPLYGDQIACMIESYVNTMNSGGIPSISTAWQQINEDEGANAYNIAMETHRKLFKMNFQSQEPKGQQIHKILRQMSDRTMDDYKKNVEQQHPQYQKKLKQYIRQIQQKVIEENKRQNERRNVLLIKQIMSPVVQNFEAKAYENNPQKMNQQIKKATQQYNKRARGQTKGELLSEFLSTINLLILSKPTSVSIEQQNYFDKVIDANNKQVQLLRKQIEVLKRQGNRDSKQDPKKPEKPKVDPKPPNKKPLTQAKVKGCCGNQKCTIM